MKKQPICEECAFIYTQDFPDIRINKAKNEKYIINRSILLQNTKETLRNILEFKKKSQKQIIQNQIIRDEIDVLKKSVKIAKTNEEQLKINQKNSFGAQSYKEILASTAMLEQKLVQIKFEYAKRSEEIEEIKDALVNSQSIVNLQDREIMRLNKEIQNFNDSIDDEQRDSFKPPRQSLGSPRSPIVLLRKKN